MLASTGEGRTIFLRGDHSTGVAQQREETNLILTLIDYNEPGLRAGLLTVEVFPRNLDAKARPQVLAPWIDQREGELTRAAGNISWWAKKNLSLTTTMKFNRLGAYASTGDDVGE